MNHTQDKINIDIKDSESIVCEKCNNDTFSPTFFIKRISALISPTAKETLIPIQVFKCDSCSHVNELFLHGLTN